MIRFAISLQSAGMQSLRREVRHKLAEQLVNVKSGHCPAQAETRERQIYDMFLPIRSSENMWSSKWNGGIRKHSVIEQYEQECCRSRMDTLRLVSGEGLRCFFPRGIQARGIQVLQRSKWTGTSGMQAHVHGLLAAVFL